MNTLQVTSAIFVIASCLTGCCSPLNATKGWEYRSESFVLNVSSNTSGGGDWLAEWNEQLVERIEASEDNGWTLAEIVPLVDARKISGEGRTVSLVFKRPK